MAKKTKKTLIDSLDLADVWMVTTMYLKIVESLRSDIPDLYNEEYSEKACKIVKTIENLPRCKKD